MEDVRSESVTPTPGTSRCVENACTPRGDLMFTFRGGLFVFPNTDSGAVASRHTPFRALQHVYGISQARIIDGHTRSFLFAQCTVDPKAGLISNGMHPPIGAVCL